MVLGGRGAPWPVVVRWKSSGIVGILGEAPRLALVHYLLGHVYQLAVRGRAGVGSRASPGASGPRLSVWVTALEL